MRKSNTYICTQYSKSVLELQSYRGRSAIMPLCIISLWDLSIIVLLLSRCYLTQLLNLTSHTSLEECHASLYYSHLSALMGSHSKLRLKQEDSSELNICRFIVDDSTAKYTKGSIKMKDPKSPNVISTSYANDN